MESKQGNTAKTELLEARITALEAVLLTKDNSIEKLTTSLEAAKFQIEEFQRLIYGSKRERFAPKENDTNQLAFDFEPTTVDIAKTVSEQIEKQTITYERNKVRKPKTGRIALPEHLEVVEIRVEPNQDTTGMTYIGDEITDELDYAPATLHINRYIRPKYITAETQGGKQSQVIAKLDRPIPKCIASTALLTMIFVDKFVFHLPLYRIHKRIEQLGVRLPSSTLESWVKLGANLLKPLYQVHKLFVYNEIYQMVDESPIKVQDSQKKGACHTGYMWVRYAPLSNAALFEYYKSRSSKGPIDDLSSFKGYIQTDGYAGYTYLTQIEGLTHLSCWAHARRYFDKALKNDELRAAHVMKLIQVLYKIEEIARNEKMTHQQRYELRLEKALPIINEIGKYIYNQKSSVTPKSLIGRAFDYCANRWISLQNYLKNGMLEIDSNLVENSIRPLAIGRKNYLFAGSHDSAQNIAMFYSFFATCKKNDIDPQAWLNYVMKVIHKTDHKNFKILLPQFIDKKII